MHSTRRLLSHYIGTLHRPPLSDVSARLAQSQPVIIRGALSHWPALTDWTLANGLGRLRARAEGVMVPVEWGRKGRGFLDGGEKGKGEMPLDVFLDAFLLDRIPKADPSSPLSEIIFYSAQHDLLSAVPELKEDLPPFKEPYLTAGKGEFWRSNVWIGPVGTFSPIHKDPYHNLFCQLVGTKTFHLYPPSTPATSLYLAPFPQHQTSLLPVSPPNVCLKRYPLFTSAREKGEVRVVVSEGEVLVLPEGWWHCVEAEEEEGGGGGRISVNFWFR